MAKRSFTLEDRYKAATALVATCSPEKAAEQTGISASTLYRWAKDDEFRAMCQEVRAHFGEEIKDNLAQIVREGSEQIRDRIVNGDFILDKNGELKRRPMSGRDLTIATGTAFDKLRVIEGQPTQIIEHGANESLVKLAHLRAIASDPEAGKLSPEQWWGKLSDTDREQTTGAMQGALARLTRDRVQP